MKLHKLLLIISFIALSTGNIFAQNNEMKARIAYEDAEAAFQNKEYEKAIMFLTEAEKQLGKWTPKVAFLKIQALDIVINYSKEWNDNTTELYQQVKEYMKYADKNSGKVDMDKMRDIYAIEKRIDYAKKKKDFEADADYIAGKQAYDKKDYEVAMNHYLKAAQKNNTRAMDAISDMYRDAVGVTRDYSKSLEWDTKASKLGDPIAASDIGYMYLSGLGITKDFKKALEYSLIGAEYEIDYAMSNIGEIYHNGGNGVGQDYTEAMNWFKKAAQKEYHYAMYQIGNMYHNGIGIKQSYLEAIEWYKKASEKGMNIATAWIGSFYHKGNGVTQDYDQAINWYKKALALSVEQNDKASVCNMIATANYDKANYEQAMEWSKKAYETGNIATKTTAKNRIATMYEHGLGVDKDKKMAKEWRNK